MMILLRCVRILKNAYKRETNTRTYESMNSEPYRNYLHELHSEIIAQQPVELRVVE